MVAKNNYYMALGSNCGTFSVNSFGVAQLSIASLIRENLKVLRKSALYQTPAFPAGSGPDFVNAVIELETSLTPIDLLAILHKIEDAFDRERPYRWAPRSLDLDLIAASNSILPNRTIWKTWAELSIDEASHTAPKELILPHPRMQERAFVLGPMRDIAPVWRHPVLGKTVEEMWHELPQALRNEIQIISHDWAD